MTETIESLPTRPLTKAEVLSLRDDMREYCIDPEADEAYVVSMFGRKKIHALGYDENAEGWVKFYSEDLAKDTKEDIDAFEEVITEWAEERFGERLKSGELKMSGPDDPPIDGENNVPPEVEMGLEPEYDCPECNYYETGLTTGPHAFLDHLRDVHDYSNSEAFSVLDS